MHAILANGVTRFAAGFTTTVLAVSVIFGASTAAYADDGAADPPSATSTSTTGAVTAASTAVPAAVSVAAVTPAMITGQTYSFQHTPLAGVPVTAYRVVGLGSEATFTKVLTVDSAVDGSYSLSVAPDTYAVLVGGEGSVYPALWVTNSNVTDLSEEDSYYAQRFALASGQNKAINAVTGPRGSIQGVVRVPGGPTPLEGVEVSLYKLGMAGRVEVASQRTKADGSYSFPDLASVKYEVVAIYGQRENSSGEQQPPGAPITVDIYVRFDATISGTIRDAGGVGLVGALVEAVTPSGAVALSTSTDASGGYTLQGLEVGRFTIRASAEGRVPFYLGGASSPLDATYLTTADAAPPITNTDIQFPASPRIAGRVVDSSGAPVAGADVFLISKSDPSDVSAQSAVDGGFTFSHVPAGSYTVLINHPDGSELTDAWYQSATEQGAVYFTVGGDDVDLGSTTLAAAGTISGTVTPQNSAYGATVTLYRWSAGGIVVPLQYMDFDAGTPITFLFTNLVAGDYALSVTNGAGERWYGGVATASAATPITLAAGGSRTGLTIDFPHFSGAISGKVTAAAGVTTTDWANAYVYAETLDGSQGLGVVPGSDGRFTISGLAPGTYRVAVQGLKGHVESWYRAGTTATPSAAGASAVAVGASTLTVNFTAIAANSSLDGQLVTAGGPLREAVVTLLTVDVDGWVRYVDETTTDVDGRYYFLSDLRQGEYYTLYTQYYGGDEYWTTGQGGSVADLTEAGVFVSNAASLHHSFTLAQRDSIAGGVFDSVTHQPAWDVLVTAVSKATGESFTGRTNQYGTYSIDHLRLGAYTLRFGDFSTADALHGYYAPQWFGDTVGEAGSTVVQVVNGTFPVAASFVERGALIAGTVKATIAANPAIWLKGALVKLYSSTGELLASTEVQSGYLAGDAPGAFRFRVKAGTYKICVTPPDTRQDIVPGCWNGIVDQAVPGNSPITGAPLVLVAGDEQTGVDIGLVAWQILTSPTPTITGTAAVGKTVTANPGAWTDGTTFTYKWLSNGVAISGATNSTLVVTPAMLGKTISVSVTGSMPGYRDAVKSSAPTAAVVAGTLLAPTPTISGGIAVGFTLTAVPGTWTAGTTLKYQWYASGVAITGATTSKLVLGAAQKDKQISVRVTGSLTGYTTVTRASAATAKVTTVGTPTITGVARIGAVLTASPGTWATSTVFAYQWYADGVAITGATKTAFGPTIAQDGKAITVRVTGTKPGYATATRSSAATLRVMRYSAPTITGTLAVGSVLTANPNTWSAGTVFTFQWFASGVAVSGATKSTFALTSAQRDKQVTVKVTGAKTGFTTVATGSAATARVATASTPTITGVFMSGATLTANPNAWTTGTTFTYQWYADGVAITGATLKTFALTAAQHDTQMSVIVTGAKSGYGTVARGSVKSLKIALTSAPTISGTPAVGSVLTAGPGTWTTGTAFTYQWYAGGVALTGATAPTLTLTAINKGKVIAVRVIGTLSGYQTIARASVATPPVL